MSGAASAEGGPTGGSERKGNGVTFGGPQAGSRLYQAQLRDGMEGGLRRRKGAEVPGPTVDTEVEKGGAADAVKTSPGVVGSLYSAVTAPVRGAVGVGKMAINGVASTLSPFAWADFMFQWVGEITPVRLKRLGSIFWNALSHITDLSGTQPGKELGWAARNVIDSFVETVAAPKGQKFVMDAGQTFVRGAEAFDTPEARAAYTQFFKMIIAFLEAMATEEGKDLFKNMNDFVLRLSGLANSPETTVAVAEFVATVCKSLQQEHESFARERMNDLSPFIPPEGEDGKPKRREDGHYFWNEEFVLGMKSASQAFKDSGSVAGDEEGEGSEASPAGGAAPSGAALPSWDSERLMDITTTSHLGSATGRSSADYMRRQQLDKTQLLQQLFDASIEAAKAKEAPPRAATEETKAITCIISFFIFLTWTFFAIIGVKTSVSTVYAMVFDFTGAV